MGADFGGDLFIFLFLGVGHCPLLFATCWSKNL